MSHKQLLDCRDTEFNPQGFFYYVGNERVDKSTGTLDFLPTPLSHDRTHPNARIKGENHGRPEYIPYLGGNSFSMPEIIPLPHVRRAS